MNLKQIIKNLFVLIILSIQAFACSEESKDLNLQIQKNIIDNTEEQEKLDGLVGQHHNEQKKLKHIVGKKGDYRYAFYINAIEEKLGKILNIQNPQVVKNVRTNKELEFVLDIKPDGKIDKIIIKRSTGNKELDDAALSIVESAAPFNKFSDEMSKGVDILSITFCFTKKSRLDCPF
jgi:TonB family protein